jgi:hypothetical protein
MRCSSQNCDPLTFAILAAFGFVFERLVVEEQLFTRCEHKIRATIDALQYFVLVFHGEALPFRVPACTGDPNREGSGSHRGAGDLHPPRTYWTRPATRCAPSGY